MKNINNVLKGKLNRKFKEEVKTSENILNELKYYGLKNEDLEIVIPYIVECDEETRMKVYDYSRFDIESSWEEIEGDLLDNEEIIENFNPLSIDVFQLKELEKEDKRSFKDCMKELKNAFINYILEDIKCLCGENNL